MIKSLITYHPSNEGQCYIYNIKISMIYIQLIPFPMIPLLTEFRLQQILIYSPFNQLSSIFYSTFGFHRILLKTDKIGWSLKIRKSGIWLYK